MSYWNSQAQTVTTFAPEPYPDYAGWERVDCHCCGGLTWTFGGECRDCGGGGSLARHVATRTLALWPGGPLRGHDAPAPDKPIESTSGATHVTTSHNSHIAAAHVQGDDQ